MRKTWVQSLGWEDPLGKEMATHSSILAWRIPWMEKPDGLQSMELQKSQIQLSDFTFTFILLDFGKDRFCLISIKLYYSNYVS